MEHKYIEIKEWKPYLGFEEKKHKTKVYKVWKKSEYYSLGNIKWNIGWRQYCFYPTNNTVYNYDYLNFISEFVERTNIEHKGG